MVSGEAKVRWGSAFCTCQEDELKLLCVCLFGLTEGGDSVDTPSSKIAAPTNQQS
jgi:hypothetical protein